MENNSYHVPFYVVTGGVATSGHSADLASGKVGLFDRATFSVATGIGNGKEFFFAQGPIGGLDWYGQPVKNSHKSPFFFGHDVEDMYLSRPQTIANEEWVIGFNGGPSSKSLSYETGKSIRVKFYFHGQPVYRFFNGPKEYVVSYTPKEDCTTPCSGSDCPDAITDCLTHTQALIDNINHHPELRKFGVTAKLVTADYSAAATNMTKWCITLCDNGDAIALQAVEATAPAGSKVVRTVRNGSQSTYQVCLSDSTYPTGPSSFTQTGSVLLAVCNECPADSWLLGAKDVYLVTRPIVGGEDFTTAASRDTYANTIWATYASAASITTTTSTTSTTTASGTLPNSDAVFVSFGSGEAVVKLKFPTGTTVTAVGTDVVTLAYVQPAECIFDDATPVAWTDCGSGISSSRTLRLSNINQTDCTGASRAADITAALAGVVGINNDVTRIAGTDCKDDYTVTQTSIDCLDEGCLTSNVTFTYDTLPAFENSSWVVVPETVVADATRKCGIRVTAGYIDPKFGDCSFNPMDYYETEPIKMEVSLLGENDDVCDVANWPTVSQSRIGRISRQSGEYVVREVIMKTEAYLNHINQFSLEPRMREAFDQNLLQSVDRNAYYNLYYVRFKASYGVNGFRKKSVQETFTAVFAFKEGDAAAVAFENNVLNVITAKSGVTLHINEANVGGSSGMQGI